MRRVIGLGVVAAFVLLAAGTAQAQENVTWTNLVAASAAGNDLTKTGSNTRWDAGASSTRAIASGNGYAEFTATQANVSWMAGLNDVDGDTDWHEIDYAVYFCQNGWIYAYDDTGKYWLSPYSAGTVVRVEIQGADVIYRVDGIVRAQHPHGGLTYPLLLDASLYSPGAVVADAALSGSLIDVVHIQDVVWTNKVFSDDGGGSSTLTKTGIDNRWTSGGSSTKAIASGDGYAEFTVQDANIYWMAGLSNGDSSPYWEDIDYAIYVCGNGSAYAFHMGDKYWLGRYDAGTVFRVEIKGTDVLYKVNGVTKAQQPATLNYPLLLDSSIYTPGAAVSNAVIAGDLIDANTIQSVVWQNVVGASDSGNTLTKVLPDLEWNAGASSQAAIASGDGYAEFTVTQANVSLMAGLGDTDLTTDWSEIDYVIYACANGHAYAYHGNDKYWLGPYTAGTTFRIELEGSNVLYKVDGLVRAQHAADAAYPLRLDTSLYTPGGVISNAIIAGNLE